MGILKTILILCFVSCIYNSSYAQSNWTTSDIIDEHIDVHAQRSLMRFVKGDVVQRKIASDLLNAIKRGDIEGIYIADQGVPALRAKAIGKGWWELVPKGQAIACMTEPENREPLLVLPKNILSDNNKVDKALMAGWAMLYETPVEKKMHTYEYSVESQLSIAGNSGGAATNQDLVYPYSPQELSVLIDYLASIGGWSSGRKEQATKHFIRYALMVIRVGGNQEMLKQFENGVLKSFPQIGAEVMKEVVELNINGLSSFRRDLLITFKNLEGRKLKDGLFYGSLGGGSTTSCGDYVSLTLKHLDEDYSIKIPNFVDRRYKYDTRLRRLKTHNMLYGFFGDDLNEQKKINAWTEGAKNLPKTLRPKPGDIYLLYKLEADEDCLAKNTESFCESCLKCKRHIGYIKSIKVISETEEHWITSDGGQEGPSRLENATAERLRIYNPIDNTIEVKNSKVAKENIAWLRGWIEADKILEH